jgi:sarcosine oxidase gamma subunit
MRDRGAFWGPVPVWQSALIDRDDTRVFAVCDIRQILMVSGDVGAFMSRHGVMGLLGPRDIVSAATYALRLAPDRVLYVSDTEQAIDLGWSAAGYAAAEMTDGFIVVDVSGPRSLDLMQQGTSYDLTAADARPSESANIVFGGLSLAVVRRPEGWRLHVERPHATALWTSFRAAASLKS